MSCCAMAMDMLERIASEEKPGQARDAEHKFAKNRFIARYIGKSTPEESGGA